MHGRMRPSGALGVLLAVLVAGAASVSAARSENTPSACAAHATKATIGGRRTCLRTGARCSGRFERQYARYGFSCDRGLLVRRRSPAPPAPTPPATGSPPAPPANPFVGMWWAIDPTDGSLEQVTFGADGSMAYQDDGAHVCGGVVGYATATGIVNGNAWTANAPTSLTCPSNNTTVPGHLFQFTLNPDGTMSEVGVPDLWTRTHP